MTLKEKVAVAMRRWGRCLVISGLLSASLVGSHPADANAPALGNDDVIEVQIAGMHGIPEDAVAAVLNVTAVDAVTSGFLTVFPCDSPRPDSSNVNFTAAMSSPNLVIARLSADGTVCVYASTPVSTIIDVAGWFPAASDYTALSPTRILDTRFGNGTSVGKVAGGATVHLGVAGRGGVPASGVGAVALNVTVADADRAGFVTVFPCDAARPDASNLNFSANRASPNLVLARVAVDGTVCLFVSEGTDLIADVNGYFPASSSYQPVVPGRALDTRFGIGAPQGRVAAEAVVRLQLPVGPLAVALNITAANAIADGFLTVYPCDAGRPDASNLNFRVGDAVPNLTVSRIAGDGAVCLYSSAPVDLIADVNGWFSPATPYRPILPTRILDGRHCDVASYTINGELYVDDYDTGATTDLGPAAWPSSSIFAMDPPVTVGNDCWLYFNGEVVIDHHLHVNLFRVPAKALNVDPQPIPGAPADVNADGPRLIGVNGRYIYTYQLAELGLATVSRIDTATGDVTVLVSMRNMPRPSISADGRYLLFWQVRPTLPQPIVTRYDITTDTAIDFPQFSPSKLQISPDGSMFAQETGDASGGSFLVRSATDGTVLHQEDGEIAGWTATGDALFVRDGQMLAWSPTGTRLYADLGDATSYSDSPTVHWPEPF